MPKTIADSPEPGRWIAAHWSVAQKTSFWASLQITSIDREGLIFDISQVLMNMRVRLSGMNARSTKDGNTMVVITVNTEGLEHLRSIITHIEKIHGVFHVERLNQ